MMKIVYKNSPTHGNGIFATEDISQDEIIEICPIIILNGDDTDLINKTHLYNYYFSRHGNWSAIALGYWSIYNHSYDPNIVYHKDFSNNTITCIAIRDIQCHDELLSNYNGNPDDQTKVWFDEGSEKIGQR